MTWHLDRRRFIGCSAASALGAGTWSASLAGRSTEGTAIEEPKRATPVAGSSDVVVCGAGPAGVAAAVAAARQGATVQLLENHGQLGGIWTTGLLSWIIDAGNKPGVMQEILTRLAERQARYDGPVPAVRGSYPYDVEQMKLILEQLVAEVGVRVRLHTRVVAAHRAGRRVTHCITESKSGREAFAGRVLIDCTGDGDLAALAGCQFELGRPAAGAGAAGSERVGETQPFSLMMLVTGIDPQATALFHEREGRPWAAPKDALLAELRRAGVEPSYGRPTIFRIYDDLYAWMVNHEYGCSAINAQDVTDATVRSRAELHRLIDALRQLGAPWSGLKIVATAAQIGTREGRRVHGRYTVTVEDMLAGRQFEDGVCDVTFGIDVHSTSKGHSTGIESASVTQHTRPYAIPLRSLVAADVDGVLLAGRCISGDFLAHSSYRVTGNAVAMGEAAGVTAALAAAGGCLPHEVPWASVSAALRAEG